MEATAHCILSEQPDVRAGVAEGDPPPGATVAKGASTDRFFRTRPPARNAQVPTKTAAGDRSGTANPCQARISPQPGKLCNPLDKNDLELFPTTNPDTTRTAPRQDLFLSPHPHRGSLPTHTKNVQQEDDADAVHLPDVFFEPRRRRIS